jgi:hypothetical protein
MRGSLARIVRSQETTDEALVRTAQVISLRRKAIDLGLALIDLTLVNDPAKRREYEAVARAQVGGGR